MREPRWKANAAARARLLDEVIANPNLSERAKLVFYALIGHLDLMTLQCNPGRARLAAKLGGRSTDTIKRGLRELLAAGVITRRLTKKSPLYQFPNLEGGQPCTPQWIEWGQICTFSRGGRSALSSGGNPAPQTLEPDDPKKRGNQAKGNEVCSRASAQAPEQEQSPEEKEKADAACALLEATSRKLRANASAVMASHRRGGR